MKPKTLRAHDGSPLLIREHSAVHRLLQPHVKRLEQEVFWCIPVNILSVGISLEVVAKGTACSVEVHPRDVFRAAVRCNASGIVVAHNHPSESVEISNEDVELTKRLVAIGKLLGIPVMDHVIVTVHTSRSLREHLPTIWGPSF